MGDLLPNVPDALHWLSRRNLLEPGNRVVVEHDVLLDFVEHRLAFLHLFLLKFFVPLDNLSLLDFVENVKLAAHELDDSFEVLADLAIRPLFGRFQLDSVFPFGMLQILENV